MAVQTAECEILGGSISAVPGAPLKIEHGRLNLRLRLVRVVCLRMTNRSATRTINLNDALTIAEELVSAPGNDTMVVWLQPTRGGVTLRQEFVARPAQPARTAVKATGFFRRWFGN